MANININININFDSFKEAISNGVTRFVTAKNNFKTKLIQRKYGTFYEGEYYYFDKHMNVVPQPDKNLFMLLLTSMFGFIFGSISKLFFAIYILGGMAGFIFLGYVAATTFHPIAVIMFVALGLLFGLRFNTLKSNIKALLS